MRISSFAKKFNVSIDTIRYYMNLGLLIPVKTGTYYDFDQTCEDDMKIITELKSFEFTLNEIREIIDLKRITLLRDHEDLALYMQMLERKKKKSPLKFLNFTRRYKKLIRKLMPFAKRKPANQERVFLCRLSLFCVALFVPVLFNFKTH